MSKDSTIIAHHDVARLLVESTKEMIELARTGKPFMLLTQQGIQMHGGEQDKEAQVRDFAVMTQQLINEVNKFCLANLGKDFNAVVLEEYKSRNGMVADQEIPDNSAVNAKHKKG